MPSFPRQLSQFNQVVTFSSANDNLVLANAIVFSDGTTINTSAGLSGSDSFARDTANASFNAANTAGIYANGAFAAANAATATDLTQNNSITAAFNAANTADVKATSAGIYANGSFVAANSSGSYANSAFAAANASIATNLTQNNSITAAFNAANTADVKATSAGIYANGAFESANSAGRYANGAFTRANNAINANTGGTITGNVTIIGDFAVTGNMTITGNVKTIDTQSLNISDPLLYLAANNYQSDLVDIGFTGNYFDGSVQRHAGFFRRAADGIFYIFNNYSLEPNNVIDITNTSFRVATINANIVSQTVSVRGTEVLTFAQAGFTAANSAGIYANGAFAAANAAAATNLTQNNSITAAFNAANTADVKATSAGIYANGAFAAANAATATDATQNNSITAAFNAANTADVKATSAGIYANGAFESANSAGRYANGAFIRANNSLSNVDSTIVVNGSSVLYVSNTLSSVSYNTGSLVVNGGIGANGNLYLRGASSVWAVVANSNNYQLSMSLNDSLGSLAIGWGLTTSPATFMSMTASGGKNQIFSQSRDFRIVHGASTESIYIHASQSSIQLISTETSTSNSTGALKVNGGLGVKGNVYADAIYDSGIEVITFAGNAYNAANTADVKATSAGIYANGAFAAANAATATDTTQNTNITSASNYANGAFESANSGGRYANGAYAAANTADNKGTAAGIYANGAFESANSAGRYANGSFTVANTANDRGLSAGIYANGAFAAANAATATDTTQNNSITAAFVQANAAYTRANNSLNANTGGTISGAISVTGSITSNGGASRVLIGTDAGGSLSLGRIDNVSTLPYIDFNSGSTSTDFDVRLQSSGGTGTDGKGNLSISAAHILTGANLSLSTSIPSSSNVTGSLIVLGGVGVRGNVYADNVFSNGVEIVVFSNAAYNQANAAFSAANAATATDTTQNNSITAAFSVANTASDRSLSAGIYANGAFVAANSSGVYANGAFTRANNSLNANTGGTVTGNVTFQLANRGVDGVTFSGPGGQSLRISPNSGQGNNNGIVRANDVSLIFSAGIGLGSFTLASWNDVASGFRMGANGNVVITSANTTSTDSNTGALVVSNGIGVTGNLFMSSANNFAGPGNGDSYRLGWTDNYFNRSTQFSGLEFNGNYLSIQSPCYIETTRTLFVRGLIGNDVGNNTVIFSTTSPVLIQNSNTSISTTTGALIVAGGLGVASNVYAGNIFSNGVEVIVFANAAYNHANVGFNTANTADVKATSAGIYANGAFAAANAATATDATQNNSITAAFNAANTADVKATSAGIYANGAFAAANAAAATNLTQNNSITAAFNAANTADVKATSAGIYANGAFAAANAATATDATQNNSITAAFNAANTADVKATSAGIYANGAFAAANAATATDATQNNSITAAFNHANSAFNKANTGGTTIVDESTSAATFYPVISNTISGTASTLYIDTPSLYFVPNTGTLSANVFVSLSDKNFKNNIVKIPDATNTVIKLEGVSFNWKHNNDKAYGVIAQDVEMIIPEIVQTNEKGIKAVNYDSMIAFLIEAIKQQNDEIQDLKAKMQTINSKLNKLLD